MFNIFKSMGPRTQKNVADEEEEDGSRNEMTAWNLILQYKTILKWHDIPDTVGFYSLVTVCVLLPTELNKQIQ